MDERRAQALRSVVVTVLKLAYLIYIFALVALCGWFARWVAGLVFPTG